MEAVETIYLLPFIAAFIGWLTNYIAVKMLFHPRKEIRIFFIRFQGVFPKRQKAFAHKLGSIVSNELFSVSEVTEKLKEQAGSDAVMEKVASKIEEVITTRLPEAIPMAAMFLTPEMVGMVKELFMSDLKDMIEDVIGELSSRIESDLDVHAIVEEKVANFSSDKLEEILFSIMAREFKFIEFVGACLGFLIGITQILLLELA